MRYEYMLLLVAGTAANPAPQRQTSAQAKGSATLEPNSAANSGLFSQLFSSAASGTLNGILSWVLPGYEPLPDGGYDVASMACGSFSSSWNPIGLIIGQIFSPPSLSGGECVVDKSGGSGPFKPGGYFTDATLPSRTIYAPVSVQRGNKGPKLPLIVWGNGACLSNGVSFRNFLSELASHGFFIIANGGPGDLGMTSYTDLSKSIDWALSPAAAKYNLDTSKLAASGQSCGGIQALDASAADKRIKFTVPFNSGYLSQAARNVSQLTTTVAYFLGGEGDVATPNGLEDYKQLPTRLPGLTAVKEVGHLAIMYNKQGGSIGAAGVDYFKWKLKGENLRSQFCGNPPRLAAKNFTIQTKNGIC